MHQIHYSSLWSLTYTYCKFKEFFETFPVRRVGAECEGSVKDDDTVHDSNCSCLFLNSTVHIIVTT